MYKSPASFEKFMARMNIDKTSQLAGAAVIGMGALVSGIVTDNLDVITGSMAFMYGGLPALALAQNIQKIKSTLTKKILPEKFKQQQQDVRERFDNYASGNSKESIIDIACDAANKQMIDGRRLGAVIRHSEDTAKAIEIFDGVTQFYKRVDLTVGAAQYEPVKAKPEVDSNNNQTLTPSM
jgi:hypothetical protein